MASQVFSGSNNFSYTNTTGQNVRVIINYLSSTGNPSISWAGVTVSAFATGTTAIGRNLGFSAFTTATGTMTSNNGVNGNIGGVNTNLILPTEIMLSAGQTFSVSGGLNAYNIVIIPEAG